MITRPKHQTLRVLGALMIREMTTRYGRSAGGYIWAIVEPLGMILILALAFSQFIRTPPLGHSFIVFYATGYIPFFMYADVAANASNAVSFNRTIMHFPMVTPLDAVLARFFLSLLTVTVVSFLLFGGMGLALDTGTRLSLGPLIVSLASAAFLGLGVGTLNCALFPFFTAWRNIWRIINRPLFIISGVFFTFDSMPPPVQSILWWNPLIHVIGEARSAFYPVYDGGYVSMPYVWGVSVACLLVGAGLIARHRTFIIEND